MRNRRRGLRLYLFSISLCMCQSASQKNTIPAQLSSAQQNLLEGNEDIWREQKVNSMGHKGQLLH